MDSLILDRLEWRYATKTFDPSKKLSEEKISILKSAFNLTATSYGLQPLKLVVVGNPKIKEQMVSISYNQQQVKDASHVLVFCVERKINENFIKEHFERVEQVRKTSRTILEPFEQYLLNSFSLKNSIEIKSWMINQLYLTVGALITVCAVEGIDACPIEGFQPEKLDEFLDLESLNLESVLIMPVGIRAANDFFAALGKVRRGVDEVVIEIN